MRSAILVLIAVLLLGAGAAVGWFAARWPSSPGGLDVAPQPDRTIAASEIWPTEQEVLAYLSGRLMEVPGSAAVLQPFQGFDPDPGFEERAKRRQEDVQTWRSPGAINAGAISELKFGPSTIAKAGEPWSTVVSFRYNLGAGHTVTGTVLHKKVRSERVFLAFKVINVE